MISLSLAVCEQKAYNIGEEKNAGRQCAAGLADNGTEGHMGIYVIDFSPTGGTRKVMNYLAEGLTEGTLVKKEEIAVIDLTLPTEDYSAYHFETEDVCLIGMPSYGGRAPQTALNRMKKMEGNGASAVLVAVYGNRDIDDTLLEMKEEAESCGFHVQAAVAAVAEHSIMRQFGAGRPDEADRKELLCFAETIKAVLEQGDKERELRVPGNKPYKEYSGISMKPKGGKECTQCGVCVLQCPVQAIPLSNPRETDESECISCMRCVSVCPKKARKLNSVLLFAASKKMEKALSGRKENKLYV